FRRRGEAHCGGRRRGVDRGNRGSRGRFGCDFLFGRRLLLRRHLAGRPRWFRGRLLLFGWLLLRGWFLFGWLLFGRRLLGLLLRHCVVSVLGRATGWTGHMDRGVGSEIVRLLFSAERIHQTSPACPRYPPGVRERPVRLPQA